MELNWSTFFLEIFNFLILIWILKHFFYAPVKKAIIQRKQSIQESLAKAQNMHDAAKQLEEKYEHRLQDWEKEKQENKQQFQHELDQWKAKELSAFDNKLKNEQEKMQAHVMQSVATIIEKNTERALSMAVQFATKFLTPFADLSLERKMVDKVLVQLSQLSTEKIVAIKNAFSGEAKNVIIQSAYPIDSDQKKDLLEMLQKIVECKLEMEFIENSALLAGLTIQLGTVFLQANLQNELKFFAETENEFSEEQ